MRKFTPTEGYIFGWKNNSKRQSLYGKRCRVLVRGGMNSALVEFENGSREIISRNALKKSSVKKKKFNLNEHETWWLYDICQLNTHTIARLFDSSPRLICNYMDRFNIERRDCPFLKKGKQHPKYKASWKNKDGYVYVYSPNHPRTGNSGSIPQHVLIAEKVLGRYFKPGECVHHINGNRADNRNCNLLICSRSFHMWLEGRMGQLYKQEHFA